MDRNTVLAVVIVVVIIVILFAAVHREKFFAADGDAKGNGRWGDVDYGDLDFVSRKFLDDRPQFACLGNNRCRYGSVRGPYGRVR